MQRRFGRPAAVRIWNKRCSNYKENVRETQSERQRESGQCDRMARFISNIWQLSILEICPTVYKIAKVGSKFAQY